MSLVTRRPEIATALLRHGYGFSHAVRHAVGAGPPSQAPVVPVRMLGRPALLVGGPEGVRTFCDTTLVRRAGATPRFVGDVLFGRGAVHGLDDDAHRSRKELFVRALDVEAVERLTEQVGGAWAAWTATVGSAPVVTQDEAVRVIGRAVLGWAGLRMGDAEADRVAGWFADEVDGFGTAGPRENLRARRARHLGDRWARRLVVEERAGAAQAPPESALSLAAGWRDEDGALLPVEVAAVDLQNMIRPAVAVSRFVAFAALDLTREPSWAARLREEHVNGPAHRPMGARGPLAAAVAREVRRRAPFVPLLAAVSRRDQLVLGERVDEGQRVLLDVVGTLRDPLSWKEPRAFDPSRFLDGGRHHPDALIPQGGGRIMDGHRCPGEDPVLSILAGGVTALAMLDVERVGDDGAVDERRIPARPLDGVRIRARLTSETRGDPARTTRG